MLLFPYGYLGRIAPGNVGHLLCRNFLCKTTLRLLRDFCVILCHLALAPEVDFCSNCVINFMLRQSRVPVWFPERQKHYAEHVLW